MGIEERAAALARRYAPRLVRERARAAQAQLADVRHNRHVTDGDGRLDDDLAANRDRLFSELVAYLTERAA